MCTEVTIGSEWIDSCGDLMIALGCQLDDLVVFVPPNDLIREECLCNVDVYATAKKFGYKAKQDWKTGCGEWVFRKDGDGKEKTK